MAYNFDESIIRENTNCYKYDLREKIFGDGDVYPMWVADTDFRVPDFVLEAIKARFDHGIFGYTFIDDEYYNSILNWVDKMHSWQIKKNWIKFSPGVVPSVFASVMAYTKPSDKVIIQTPVYFPFYSAVRDTGRTLLTNPLVLRDGRYHMDLIDLKNKIDSNTKMIILCSPHNPTGNVWYRNELLELCEICLENNILIVSDEIHADIVYQGNKHIPTASLSDEIAKQTITLMAPSKTFNFAGLNSSYVITSNEELLNGFAKQIEGLHIGPNIFAVEATKAAYNKGYDWVKELVEYYSNTINFVSEFIESNLSEVNLIAPEGTFLLWLDFRKTGIKRKELVEKLVKEAKLGLSDGFLFGAEGDGFQRMNIGCPVRKVEDALLSIKNMLYGYSRS